MAPSELTDWMTLEARRSHTTLTRDRPGVPWREKAKTVDIALLPRGSAYPPPKSENSRSYSEGLFGIQGSTILAYRL